MWGNCTKWTKHSKSQNHRDCLNVAGVRGFICQLHFSVPWRSEYHHNQTCHTSTDRHIYWAIHSNLFINQLEKQLQAFTTQFNFWAAKASFRINRPDWTQTGNLSKQLVRFTLSNQHWPAFSSHTLPSSCTQHSKSAVYFFPAFTVERICFKVHHHYTLFSHGAESEKTKHF